jgi:dihydroorotate dehydrogenase (NAD+) catalytic subunit
MVAAGTFGYGTELRRLLDINRLGGLVTPGITLSPRRGNPYPRISETAGGILHATGTPNVGIGEIRRSLSPLWAALDVPIILNLAAPSTGELAELAERVDGTPGVAGIELNLDAWSPADSVPISATPQLVAEVVAAVRRATAQPVITKLTAGVFDAGEVARAAEDAGADAISCTNSLPGMTIDIQRRGRGQFARFGGLSGPAIKPIALRAVWQIASQVAIPVIGIGGIMSALDAIEFLMAGATAVQVGSATFRDPRTALEVLDGIERFAATEHIEHIGLLVGLAHGTNRPLNDSE